LASDSSLSPPWCKAAYCDPGRREAGSSPLERNPSRRRDRLRNPPLREGLFSEDRKLPPFDFPRKIFKFFQMVPSIVGSLPECSTTRSRVERGVGSRGPGGAGITDEASLEHVNREMSDSCQVQRPARRSNRNRVDPPSPRSAAPISAWRCCS